MKVQNSLLAGAAALALLSASHVGASAQTTTFGQFFQKSQGNQFSFVNNGNASTFFSGTGPSASAIPVTFTYLVSNGYGGISTPIAANLLLSASVSGPAGSATIFGSTFFSQPLTNINLSFTAITPILGKTNLLSIVSNPTPTTGAITGIRGGGTANENSDTLTANTVTFTSDFLDFSQTVDRNSALSFTSVTPTLFMNANGFLNSFTASGTGTFASGGSPIRINAVPEPGVTALLGGLGVVGTVFGVRRRKKR